MMSTPSSKDYVRATSKERTTVDNSPARLLSSNRTRNQPAMSNDLTNVGRPVRVSGTKLSTDASSLERISGNKKLASDSSPKANRLILNNLPATVEVRAPRTPHTTRGAGQSTETGAPTSTKRPDTSGLARAIDTRQKGSLESGRSTVSLQASHHRKKLIEKTTMDTNSESRLTTDGFSLDIETSVKSTDSVSRRSKVRREPSASRLRGASLHLKDSETRVSKIDREHGSVLENTPSSLKDVDRVRRSSKLPSTSSSEDGRGRHPDATRHQWKAEASDSAKAIDGKAVDSEVRLDASVRTRRHDRRISASRDKYLPEKVRGIITDTSKSSTLLEKTNKANMDVSKSAALLGNVRRTTTDASESAAVDKDISGLDLEPVVTAKRHVGHGRRKTASASLDDETTENDMLIPDSSENVRSFSQATPYAVKDDENLGVLEKRQKSQTSVAITGTLVTSSSDLDSDVQDGPSHCRKGLNNAETLPSALDFRSGENVKAQTNVLVLKRDDSFPDIFSVLTWQPDPKKRLMAGLSVDAGFEPEPMDVDLEPMDANFEPAVDVKSKVWLSEVSSERKPSSVELPVRTALPEVAINFRRSATRSSISVEKPWKGTRLRRHHVLRDLVDMELIHFDLFDLLPVRQYSRFIRSYGLQNTTQAYVQTNDDAVSCDVQTDAITTKDRWCQHPPLGRVLTCGIAGEEAPNDDCQLAAWNPQKLSRFIVKAGTAFATLLDEETAERHDCRSRQNPTSLSVSSGFVELNVISFLKDRHVMFSRFCATDTQFLLVVYSQSASTSRSNAAVSRGVICIWNINHVDRPQHILVTETQPECCCFSPSRPSLVIAGMVDGSVVLWDLRELAWMHKVYRYSTGHEWPYRRHTYNTAGVLGVDNHQSRVIAIESFSSLSPRSADDSVTPPADRTGRSDRGLSFQLASLEENGVLNLWITVEIFDGDICGSLNDLGLAPGGRIKLIKTGSVCLTNPGRQLTLKQSKNSLVALCLQLAGTHYYVTTEMGCIIRGSRLDGDTLSPRVYWPTTDYPCAVTCLDFSPFVAELFLVGCDDGSVHLFSTLFEHPSLSWRSSSAVTGCHVSAVHFSRSQPCVFFVIDSDSWLHVWDLTKSDVAPIKREQMVVGSCLSSFCLSNDVNALGLGDSTSRKPQMAAFSVAGAAEVHTLCLAFSSFDQKQVDQLKNFVQNVMH